MASERDTTPVTINLDRKRPYRVRDEDRDAVWVGPGEVQVPRWVAEAWGADVIEATVQEDELEPPVTVETVTEEPLKTTETVEIVPAEKASKPKTQAKRRTRK